MFPSHLCTVKLCTAVFLLKTKLLLLRAVSLSTKEENVGFRVIADALIQLHRI